MRLVTYVQQDAHRLGAVQDGQVVDLVGACAAYQGSAHAHVAASRLQAALPCPQDMMGLLWSDAETWKLIDHTLAWVRGLSKAERGIFSQPLAEATLAPPLANPSKIVCVGLNYHDHCAEQGLPVPQRPILFAKFPSTIIGPGDKITWPSDISQQVDYEAELAVVIGRKARDIAVEEAHEYIAGYTNLNDVSARDVQFADEQWVRGKSFDTFCPIGPYLVTRDDVQDPHDLRIRCWVNGELRQDSNTGQLVFNVPQLLAYVSKTCTLLPGDIISTGTPGGVGVFLNPPVFLKSGDTVEIEIDRLGRLRNPVG